MDCPNCDEWNLDGTVECACGYLFVGYEAKVEEEERAIRERHRTYRWLGIGMLGSGLVLTSASCFLSSELGIGVSFVFTGLIVGGLGVLLKYR